MNEILISYIEDLRDILLLFNESLIEVQNGVRNKEIVDNIFRVAHTIKGNSAAMNFTKIQKVMHTMEDLLAEVRNGSRELTDPMVEVLFACHDFLEDCLDIVQAKETDESMEIDNLLGRLISLKNNAPSNPSELGVDEPKIVVPKIEIEKEEVQDIDLGVNMPPDLWELLDSNIKNGFSAYRIYINFMKNSSMKAVRAWMIFDTVDQYGILLHSNPERMGENSFNSVGETPFETDVIEMVLISEREISELIADLKTMADIEDVSVQMLPKEDISKKMGYLKRQDEIIKKVNEINVELLGVDIQFIQPEVIESVSSKLKNIIQFELLDDNSPVMITAKRLVLALDESLVNKKRIPVNERETIIFLCQSIEDCLIKPESVNNENLIKFMYDKLDDFIQIVTLPEKRLGDILTEKNLIKEVDADYIAEKQQQDNELKFGQLAVKEKLVKAMDVVNALNDVKDTPAETSSIVKPTKSESSPSSTESGFVRVPVSKVDSLIDMLSELLIYNSQLDQSVSMLDLDDPKTSNILSRTEKLIKEIQALSMSLRMIEVKQTFHRLTRIARDAASDLKKKVTVHLEGEDTEIDRSAVEKLFEPLMHMVRNSVSHGIEESEEDRIKVGKKPDGQVTISGYSKRGNVFIEVKDDGRGIDTKRVYDKAKKLGIINESREYTDQEIFKFIFLPGFSTQEKVNAVAGRGVGMNVVEEVVTKLGGKVEVESELGSGSLFRIKLPINLAVVNGTIVEIGGIRYIIPTMCVKKFFIARDSNWVSMQGENKAIKVDGSIIPLISKQKIFGLSDTTGPDMEDDFFSTDKDKDSTTSVQKEYEMVILEIDQKLLALHVDKIVGRQDVVSKPLATDYASVAYANSASILGDGIVCLILDIDAIFKMSQN